MTARHIGHLDRQALPSTAWSAATAWAFGATKAVFSDKNAGTGKTVDVERHRPWAARTRSNYTLASNTATGTASITPKALTVAGMSAGNKVYDGNAARRACPVAS